MQNHKIERGPRGRYARIICRGCRSRKIKCVMRNRDNLGPLGFPQPQETACERCRHLKLECVFERTSLGRPAARRLRGVAAGDDGALISAESDAPSGVVASTLSSIDIKDHLFSDVAHGGAMGHVDLQTKLTERPTKPELFQSMIEPHYFLSSILAKDQAFGSNVARIPFSWSTSLTELINDDIAMLFDKSLLWHHFFLPSMPKLKELRSRLLSTEFMSTNPATKLLFALLCLTALDIDRTIEKQYPDLKSIIRLAVAFYGQEFIFSPPTHHDSVAVCLLLTDFKPTALATTQRVAHRSIKSEMFVHLARRITERMEGPSEQQPENPSELHIADGAQFNHWFHQAVENLQVLYYDTFLDGYLAKSHNFLRRAHTKIRPIVELYQDVAEHRQCSPRTIFHMNWALSIGVLLDALANLKEQWDNPGTLFGVIEEAERKCVEKLKSAGILLDQASGFFDSEEIEATRSLLNLRFNSVIARTWGLGPLYAAVLKVRSLEGGVRWDRDIQSHEAVQISDQVTGSRQDMLAGAAEPFAMALNQLGTKYPAKLRSLLDMFINCMDLKLSGTSLRPPLQHLALEIITHCKNVVENNLVHLKCFGRLNPNFSDQLSLFQSCSERFDAIVAAPWCSIDKAFANGCVYAACSKMIKGFSGLMQTLKEKPSNENERQARHGEGESQAGVDLSDIYPEMGDDALNGSNMSTEAWNMWPYVGGFDPLPNPQELYDWIESFDTDAELGNTFFSS